MESTSTYNSLIGYSFEVAPLLTGLAKNPVLKGLSHETDFKNVDENGQILDLTRAAAGF